MRGLLVNNEDLLRTNAQLNNEMKRLREQMIEIDRERQVRDEKIREMEVRTCGSATVRHPHRFQRRDSNLGLCVRDAGRGEGGPEHDGGGQQPGVRLQLPAAVPQKQDPGC